MPFFAPSSRVLPLRTICSEAMIGSVLAWMVEDLNMLKQDS
jgi:hypothetical protein